jgi:MFS family permease
MPKTRPETSGELWIATCGCLSLLVCWGLTYGMPVMFPSLAERLAGAAADRYGTPIVVTVGSLISAAGFLTASLANSELMFAIGYIVGIGAGVGLTYAPVTAAVQVLTTPKRKIVAAGITSAGVGFGSMLVPPVVSWLYNVASWGMTLQAMAVFAVAGVLPALALNGVVQKAPLPTGESALRTNSNFVWAFVGQLLFAIMFFVPFAHLVNISLWHGWTTYEGVELISLLGFGSTAGRFFVTPLAQRMGACRSSSLRLHGSRRNDRHRGGIGALGDLGQRGHLRTRLWWRNNPVCADRVRSLRSHKCWQKCRHFDGRSRDRRASWAVVGRCERVVVK